jgi:transaldolase / glucose-6-phosphate isomerase
MQHFCEADGFRRIFYGQPTIGGRFSVLSDFGMVPAAIMGLDVGRLLGQAEQMAHSCAASVPVARTPASRSACSWPRPRARATPRSR